MFCSDLISGSDFIAQTNKFLLIHAAAVTLTRKVNEYIFPDPCILCAIYLRFSWSGFDMRGKNGCGGRHGGRRGNGGGRGGNELKT